MQDFTLPNLVLIWLGVGAVVLFILYKKRSKGSISLGETRHLNRYAFDITASARAGKIDPVVGLDDEIHRVVQILTRRTKNNVLLLGQPGVGKTAVVEGLAHRIVSGNVPDVLSHKRVLLLQVSELIAGTKYRGEFEQRIKGVVQEIRNHGRQIILFIDEIHTITQTKGTEGAVSLSDILKPELARGDLQLIGATTQKEYEQYILADESWNRRFQPVIVNEPNIEESIAILEGIKKNYEDYHGVTISHEAIVAAVRLSEEYIKGRQLPDKAIDIMDETAAMVHIERGTSHEHASAVLHSASKKLSGHDASKGQDEKPIVQVEHVKEVIAEWSGITKDQIY